MTLAMSRVAIRRAAVTGAAGFLGGHTVARLRREGVAVRALVHRAGQEVEAEEVLVGDVRDRAVAARLVEGCDAVFHTAAMFRTEGAADREFFATNVEGTRVVAAAAAAAGVGRFLHVSTVGVHGATVDGPADEDAPAAPMDAYQQSKWQGEAVVAETGRQGLAATIVRPVGIHGPGDTRFLKLFRALARRRFVMIGPGTHRYHMTAVADVVDGMLAAATNARAEGRRYILCGPEAVTMNELVGRVAEAVGAPPPRLRLPLAPLEALAPVVQRFGRAIGVEPPLYPRRLEFFRDPRWFSGARAEAELGWCAATPLEQSLAQTAADYRRRGWL